MRLQSLRLLAGLVLAVGLAGCAPAKQQGAASSGDDTTAVAPMTDADRAAALAATAWKLELLGVVPPLVDAQPTLMFTEDGKIGGSGGCNRFFGTVALAGDSIHVGPLGSTKMACAPGINEQEAAYLQALQNAGRFEIDGTTLKLYVHGVDQPMVFARTEP